VTELAVPLLRQAGIGSSKFSYFVKKTSRHPPRFLGNDSFPLDSTIC
jgi:hypothetical protein